jgi:hypothetical protein
MVEEGIMTRDEKIEHWLEAARVAAEVMQLCLLQAAGELRVLEAGVVSDEASETPTAPIRPPIEQPGG